MDQRKLIINCYGREVLNWISNWTWNDWLENFGKDMWKSCNTRSQSVNERIRKWMTKRNNTHTHTSSRVALALSLPYKNTVGRNWRRVSLLVLSFLLFSVASFFFFFILPLLFCCLIKNGVKIRVEDRLLSAPNRSFAISVPSRILWDRRRTNN